MATPSVKNPLQILPGVQPNTDQTPYATQHYTFSDKVRFWRGVPQKIGGWRSLTFQMNAAIVGSARTLYSAVIGNVITTMIGTNRYLYVLYGQQLTNVTPISATTVAIPNSLSTDYATLANNPIKTTIGSNTVTIADQNASQYVIGDTYTLSGATAVGGVAATSFNAAHILRSVTAGTVSFLVSTPATSTATGGGNAVVKATGLITVAAPAHGQANGDRTQIAGAAATGGIAATAINNQFLVRNVTANTFQVMTAGTATSAVTGGGGTTTTYQTQIAAGPVNQGYGVGYGVGLYGTGLYGVSKMSVAGIVYPRIWFMDRFGDRIVMTPGGQGPIYLWNGATATAPALLANAPTAVNYAFVSNSILVTFGYQNISNQIFASDQFNATQWTASDTNQVFQQVVYGADRFISHAPVLGANLLFTPTQTYLFTYIGGPLVWQISLLDASIGIIGPLARCSVNNVAYWMSANGFSRWSGGNVENIPSNSGDQSTMLQYVFGNINTGQAYKSFAWYNQKYNEVWFHYPSANSNECNMVVRLSIEDNVWSPDTFDRTCAEAPQNLLGYPRMISSGDTFYNHEQGTDADGQPMPWKLQSNLRTGGKESAIISGFIPDSVQTGTINVNVTGQLYPQSSDTTFNNNYAVAANATSQNARIDISVGARFWTYTWSGSVLGQNWIMGNWEELVQKGAGI